MPLACRLAEPGEHEALQRMVLSSFEPVTWFRRVDRDFGPLNGQDWRARWRARLAAVFETETVLVGESEDGLVAFASGTLDESFRLAYIDLLAVDARFQGRGYGRQMLRATLAWFKQRGAEHAHLDCLTGNDVANGLYQSEGFVEVARHIRWFMRIP